MHEHERRRAAKLRADRDRLHATARQLRADAARDGYAGLRGQYAVDAVAAVLDTVALNLDTVPETVRRDAAAVAAAVLDGPDGRTDTRRVGPASRYGTGPGH